MLTYSERLNKIYSLSDLDNQLVDAQRQIETIKGISRNSPLLADKLICLDELKIARSVLKQLRLNYFEIEDQLKLIGRVAS